VIVEARSNAFASLPLREELEIHTFGLISVFT